MLWRQKIDVRLINTLLACSRSFTYKNVSILKLADHWLFHYWLLIYSWLMTDPWKSPQGESSLHWPLTPHSCLKSEEGKIGYQSIFQWKYLCHCIASRSIVMYSKIFRNFSGFDLGQDLDVWDVLFPGRGRPHLVKTKYMISVIDIGFCVLVYMWYNRVYNNKAIG